MVTERIVVRHRVATSTATFGLCFVAPPGMARRRAGEALADAVGELRAVDTTFGPLRGESLVARFRRGEIAADTYAPLADLVQRCVAMRAATDGWFDAWAVPGGFDPGGLLKGWAVERAAARLRAAGIADYAVTGGLDLTVRGHAPHGGPWRVGVRHPHDPRRLVDLLELTRGAVATTGAAGRRQHIVDPHTGAPADRFAVATVVGPDLAMADGYATALCAAGPPGLDWFPTPDGYRAIVVDHAETTGSRARPATAVEATTIAGTADLVGSPVGAARTATLSGARTANRDGAGRRADLGAGPVGAAVGTAVGAAAGAVAGRSGWRRSWPGDQPGYRSA